MDGQTGDAEQAGAPELDQVASRARAAWEQADVGTYEQLRDLVMMRGWFIDVVRQEDGSLRTILLPWPPRP